MKRHTGYAGAAILLLLVGMLTSGRAIDYVSIQNGTWRTATTWSPSGVPGAGDNVSILHRVVVDSTAGVNNININPGGKLVNVACTLKVYGNWTNNGADSMPNSTTIMTGTSPASIGGTTTTNFFRLWIIKPDSSVRVILNRGVNVTGTGTATLNIKKGTLTTNGCSLNVMTTGAQVDGDTFSKLEINGNSTVNIQRIVQTNTFGGLAHLTLAAPATLNIITYHGIGNEGNVPHRFDMSGGTVNYAAGSELYLIVNFTTGGWFATGGVANFYGNIRGTMVTRFQATGNAVVRFVGSTGSRVLLGDAWGGWQKDAWYFNDLRIEKSPGCSVKFTSGGTMLVDTNMCANIGMTVDSGNLVVFSCSTFRGNYGYVFNNVTNNGTIVVRHRGAQPLSYFTVNGDWVNNGTLISDKSLFTFQTTGTNILTPGTNSPFAGLRVNKPAGSLTVTGALAVQDSLRIRGGTVTLNKRALTIGTNTAAGRVQVDSGGTLTILGTADSLAAVSAANSNYPYNFRVGALGTVAARYVVFEYPDTSGIDIANNATVDPANNFSDCRFEHGDLSGKMLKIENSQLLDTIRNVVFNGNAGANIEKLANTGHISVLGSGGSRWGEDFDNDPNNRIDWFGPDVGVRTIIAPAGVIDSGTSVTPACSVYNYGTMTADYSVRMKIGASYEQTASVTSHTPGTCRYITFPDWTAQSTGGIAISCSTELGGDCVASNDRKTSSVFVRWRDVGATAIVAPVGVIDSGVPVTPVATVHNWGNTAATFDIAFMTSDGYYQTITRTVESGADSIFDFPDWIPIRRGTIALKCSTMLAGDAVPDNDPVTGAVDVAVHDVAVMAILAPVGSIPARPVQPQVRLHNYGTSRDALTATFRINALIPYEQTIELPDGIPVGEDTVITFPEWIAEIGIYAGRCSLYSAVEQVPANDTLSQPFEVVRVDVGVVALVAPPAVVDTVMAIIPAARIANFGDSPLSFWTLFRIDGTEGTAYLDSIALTDLSQGTETTLVFAEWLKPHPIGSYVVKCSTMLADDEPANNFQTATLTVLAELPETGWVRKADVPAGPKNKNVKDGGCLASAPAGTGIADTSYIYALKGNGRLEFYQYNIPDNVWLTKESIPAIGRSGKKKGVKKGASITSLAGRVYAFKGNNSLEFWCYDPELTPYPWTQLTDVPAGAKAIKEGSGCAAVAVGESSYVYLLKGSGTQEFYRYSIATDEWQTMTPAPLGASGKVYKNGSCLAFDGANTGYALKGSYNELAAYDAASNTWNTRASLPLIGASGKKKKAKDGAGIAWLGNRLYCLKGGNTLEFWAYQADSDRWWQLADMPAGGGKRVKGGGALTSDITQQTLFALKGNNTLEFYRYAPSAVTLNQPGCGVQTVCAITTPVRLQVHPNPFTSLTVVSYHLPVPAYVSLKLYDIAGKLVRTLADCAHEPGTYRTQVMSDGLVSGIYLLKLKTENTTTTAKLILK